MTRIFVSLAITALVLIIANMYVGLTGGDYNGISQQWRESIVAIERARQAVPADPAAVQTEQANQEQLLARIEPMASRMTFHRLLGVLAAIVTVFVNSIGITYFIGTSRWCKEVVQAYDFDATPLRQSNRLKRFTFAWALCGMLTVVGIVALGGAADPGTLRATSGQWVTSHLVAAMAGGVLISFCLYQQHANIMANQAIIATLVEQVARARQARGLDNAVAGAHEVA